MTIGADPDPGVRVGGLRASPVRRCRRTHSNDPGPVGRDSPDAAAPRSDHNPADLIPIATQNDVRSG